MGTEFARKLTDEERKSLIKEYTAEYYRIRREQLRFIIEHKASLAAVYALYQRLPGDTYLFNGDSDVVYYRTVAEALQESYPESPYLQSLQAEIARMDAETQYRLLDWMIDNGRSYSIKDVQEFVKSREAGAQASEDEKYIELLTYMRDSLEQTLRDCADRQAGILALKARFRWAGGGSSEGGFNGTSKGLELYGEDGKRILRPWATGWDMLAAMRLQDGPAPSSKAAKAPREIVEPRCGEGETPLSLAWHESGVKPPEGAHIVFIDEDGVADEDVYVSGRLKSGWADWEEVVLWTLHPDDPAQPEAASEKQLTTLCGVDLAAPEWQAGNPPKAGEYYACFDIGKNACRLATWSGWDWRFVGGATIEAPCLGWWPLPARASAKEGA